MDPTLVRVIFILLAVLGLSGVLIYIILWVVLPSASIYEDVARYQPGLHTERAQDLSQAPLSRSRSTDNTRNVAGVVLLALGIYFLLEEFFYIPEWFSFNKLWPFILIIVGVLILAGGKKSREEVLSGTDTGHSPDFREDDRSGTPSDNDPLR